MIPNYVWWAVSAEDAYEYGSMNSTRITGVSSDGSAGAPGWYTTPKAPWSYDWPYGPFGDWTPSFVGADGQLYALRTTEEGRDLRIIVHRTPLLEEPGVLHSEVALDVVVSGPDETVYSEGRIDWYARMYWDSGLVVRASATRQFHPPNLEWLTTVLTETVRESGGSRAYIVDDTRSVGDHSQRDYRETGALVKFEGGAVAFVASGVHTPF